MPTSKFNKFIGSWPVSNVEDMDHMFDGASEFDQNLGCWDVEENFKENIPKDFATGSNLTSDHLPHWGQPPSTGCHELLHIPLTEDAFIIRIVIEEADKTFTWPVRSGSTNISCTVYWGDETFSDIDTDTSPRWTHTFATAGTYEIAVQGTCSAPDFTSYTSSAQKITNIIQWGNMTGATNWSNAFQGCWYLQTIEATDQFGTGVTDTSGMFYNCHLFLGNNTMGTWVMSDVIDISEMFYNCYAFNQNIGTWNTQSVQYMERVFAAESPANRTTFNTSINAWNVTSVKSMAGLFENTGPFNQPLNLWVTSSLLDTSSMFRNAMYFNKDLKTFDMSKVLDVSYMFYEAGSFNKNIWSWDTTSIENFDHFFGDNETFNKNLSCWDVSRVVSHDGFIGTVTLMPEEYLPKWGQEPNTDCSSGLPDTPAFIIKISISNPGDTITWVTRTTSIYDCYINWGDSQVYEHITTVDDPRWNHTYSQAGIYLISLIGTAGAPKISAIPIIDIMQWGELTGATDWSYAFKSCINLQTLSATDTIQSGITNMLYMFAYCTNFNSSLANWNVESVTNMGYMFAYCTNFNQDLSSWNPINVTNMSDMFAYCNVFNGNVSSWNLSNITNLTRMFYRAFKFNQPLNDWNITSKLATTDEMFAYTQDFNQDLNNWDTSGLTNVYEMFFSANAFNGNVSGWNLGSLTSTAAMFKATSAFNQPLNSWTNMSKITDMSSMFYMASAFNQDLNNWDVSKVQDMSYMFYSSIFNGNISNWDTSSCTNMEYMFYQNVYLNQNLSCWNARNVISSYMFVSEQNAYMSVYELPKFGQAPPVNCTIRPFKFSISIPVAGNTFIITTRPVTNKNLIIDWGDNSTTTVTDSSFDVNSSHVYASSGTFTVSLYGTSGAPSFAYNISLGANRLLNIKQWGYIEGATDWTRAFYYCGNLSTIGATDIPPSTITNMSDMFRYCSILNDSIMINQWDTTNVTNMSGMFYGCTAFNQDISTWNTINVTDMSYMFGNAEAFNKNIGAWKVQNVQNMSYMFYGYSPAFNQNISQWDTSSCTNMSHMFWGYSRPNFTQDLSTWKVQNVQDMSNMFSNCIAFNSDLSNWNTSSCTNMSYMFQECWNFNQYLGNWDVSKVTDMSYMFSGSPKFQQNLSCWNVEHLTNSNFYLNFSNYLPLFFYPKWGQTPDIGCTANAPYIQKPTIVSPYYDQTNVAINLTVTASAFTPVNGSDTHISSSWICTKLDGSIVAQSLNDTINKTSWTIPITLNGNTYYYIKVKYTGTQFGDSLYSSTEQALTYKFKTVIALGSVDSIRTFSTYASDIGVANGTAYLVRKTNFTKYTKALSNGLYTMTAGSSYTMTTVTNDRYITFDGTTYMWSCTSSSNNIIKTAMNTGSTTGTYTTGGTSPYGIVCDGTYVWTANYGSNNISKINKSTGALIETYAVGIAPQEITADGTYVWVILYNLANNTSKIVKVQASNGTIIGTYTLTFKPTSVIHDGTYLWIVNSDNNAITKVDPTTGTELITYTDTYSSPYRIVSVGSDIWGTYSSYGYASYFKMNKTTGEKTVWNYSYNPDEQARRIASDGTNLWITVDNYTLDSYYIMLVRAV